MAKTPKKPERAERKTWFNWPLVLGLVLNFAILALVASCAVHLLHVFGGGANAR